MDGVNFSHILRRPMEPIPESPASHSEDTSSQHDGGDVETLTGSSTTGSSYTSCSHGSLPSPAPHHPHHPNADVYNESDEVAVGVLPKPLPVAQQNRSSGTENSTSSSGANGKDEVVFKSGGGGLSENDPFRATYRGAGCDDRLKKQKPSENGNFSIGDGDDDGDEEGEEALSSGLPVLTKRVELKPHIDLDDDSPSLRAYWDALFYPEVYMKVFYALRITLLVALPLAILARHPKVMNVFPAHVVLPLWGIVDCKYTVGEQVAQSLVSIQCGVWMMCWGALNNSWGLLNHYGAWWCAALFGAFGVSMLGSVRGRRLFVLQTVMILQMENLPGGTDLIYPVKVGRDMIMSTAFSLLQVFFPPRSIAVECDKLMGSGWKDMGRILRTAVTAVWTDDPIQSVIALGKLSTDPLQHVFVATPPMLFSIMYEPWESTLRLELRKERLEVMKLCTPRIHSVAGTARSLVMKRVFNIYDDVRKKNEEAEKAGREKHSQPKKPHVHHHHHHHHQKANKDSGMDASGAADCGLHSPLSDGGHEPFAESNQGAPLQKKASTESADAVSADTPEYFTTVRRSVSKMFGLRGPPKTSRQTSSVSGPNAHKDIYVQPFHVNDEEGSDDGDLNELNTDISPYAAMPRERRARDQEMEKLRQNRLKVQYRMEQRLRSFGKAIIEEPLKNFLDKLDAVLEGLGQHLNPKETVERVPFEELQDASAELEMALNKIHFEILIKSDDPVDPFIYTNTIFFHQSMIVLAERLIEYGRLMRNFDRKRYKSQWARIWEFFFYDWWKGFFNALPNRLSLATPRDQRILKDAIKMALAYGVGIMFTEYTDPENIYYFGMAILMGVGWPTAGDTMVASVYRITGMVCACSIAYVAIWHTHNLTQEIVIALAGTFLALIFRDVPPYSHTAQYCSMLICTALNSASTKLVLLARIVSNSFTVMCYYVICIFLFPTSVLKITHATEARAIMAITERFSALTDIMTAPLYPDDPDEVEAIEIALDILAKQRVRMWSLVAAFREWIPKASAEPSTHGLPYPTAQQTAALESLRRLAAVTDIAWAGLKHLHRRGAVAHDKYNVEMMLRAVVPVMVQVDRRARVVMQDFLDAAARPYEWSPERATRHLSEFLFLSDDLHRAFYIAHRRNTRALREHFSTGVMNRTFAAAARANIIEPTAAAAAAAALAGGDRKRSAGAGGGAASPASFAGNPSSLSQHASPPRTLGANPDAASSFGGAADPESGSVAASTNASRQTARFHTNISDVEEEEAQYDDLHPPPVTNESVTAAMLGHLKRVEEHSAAPSPRADDSSAASEFDPNTFYLPKPRHPATSPVDRKTDDKKPSGNQRKGNDNPLEDHGEGSQLSSVPKRSTSSSAFAASPSTAAAREEVPPNMSFTHVVSNCSMTAKELEKALKPMEKQAEDDEYQAFVAKRKNPHFMLREGEYTINHDVNSIISLLVAADIFFAEAEKLVKTMYHINSYAKSHKPMPGSSIWDMNDRSDKKDN